MTSGIKKWVSTLLVGVVFFCSINVVASGSVEDRILVSNILKKTKHPIDVNRKIKVYLPEGYHESDKAYPVVYYHHSFSWDNQRLFENGAVKSVLDTVIEEGTVGEFIFVAADYTNSFLGSFYENNRVSGRWLDYTVKEVVPFIDSEYRTIKSPEARVATGDYFGGYAALKLGMQFPDTFGLVYSLSPVATGYGYLPMVQRPNWRQMHEATNYEDLDGGVFERVFLAMAQAYLPNPKKAPFFCDFITDYKDGKISINAERADRLRAGFLLDRQLPEYASNLKKLKSIKIDWARYDPNQDHVLANQAFTRLLDEYGVDHEAEEYRGNPFDTIWSPEGRVFTDMAPFLNRHLKFEL